MDKSIKKEIRYSVPSYQKIWDRSFLARLGVGIGGSLPKPSPGTESFLLPPAAAWASLPHTCLSNLASEPDAQAIQGGMVCWIQCFPITLLWLSHTQSSLVDLTSNPPPPEEKERTFIKMGIQLVRILLEFWMKTSVLKQMLWHVFQLKGSKACLLSV